MPFYDIYSDDVRCGRGAVKSGAGIKTAEVFAGDEVGFVVGRSAMETCQPLEPHVIYHNGPGQAYLSRSTTVHVRDYEGEGDWFKISYLGATNDTWWLTRGQTGMNFTIPATTPPGQYLLRVEHLYVRYPLGTTQFYIACAQVDVFRPPGRGVTVAKTPDPEYMARFPGAYQLSDEGINVPEYMYDWPNSRLMEYKPPGPPMWTR
ncbi:glycoside hydrolase [Lasiosphaeria hispida]|uniref:lytic cellulose monooxygenase (C4-dehydrogenating) n=1 Tax=Lasiosphaeria hispida TaxID=260671 RepID=A0AAJ0HLU0_9PEZI|nr:glycoside hydrolase [Lasiosphaeria hispida]